MDHKYFLFLSGVLNEQQLYAENEDKIKHYMFFNNLKNERVHGRRYATRDEARTDVFDYIETFYNRSRRHSALLGKTPASAFEAWVLKQQGKMAA